MLNFSEVENGIVISFIGAACGWVFHSILKLQKDMNCLWARLRRHEEEDYDGRID